MTIRTFKLLNILNSKHLSNICDWCGVSVGQADSADKAGGSYCGLALKEEKSHVVQPPH